MTRLVVAVLSVLATKALGAGETPCSFSHQGSTFDLSALRSSGYHVDDSLKNTPAGNFSYYFNVCGNIPAPRGFCIGENGGPEAPVYQVFEQPPDATDCHSLGAPLTADTALKSRLLDPKNPAAGIKLMYTGGDICGNLGSRNFTINLMCEDDVFNIPDEEPVIESPTCSYEIFLKTIYGCPTECPVVNRQLCGGRGQCGYDPIVGASRCFCYDNQFGDDCSQEQIWTAGNTSAVVVVAVLCIIILVLLIFVTQRVWKNVTGLRLDPEAYSSMGDSNMGQTGDMGGLSAPVEQTGEDEDDDAEV